MIMIFVMVVMGARSIMGIIVITEIMVQTALAAGGSGKEVFTY